MGRIGILFLDNFSTKKLIKSNDLVFSIYGLGYVGLTLAAVWLRAGAKVIGVDVDASKVNEIMNLQHKFVEPEIEEAIKRGISEGKFLATLDGIAAAKESDVKIVTVPVYLKDGAPDLSAIRSVAEVISKGITRGDLVVVESSVPPGTTLFIGKIIEEMSGLKMEDDFGLGYSPERIYIGRGVRDIEERYPKIISGVGPKSTRALKALYEVVCKKGVLEASDPIVAELEKLFEGVYRDVNIALANELARLCSALGVDYNEVRKLANSQPFCHLHKPGAGVGGACIPVYPLFIKKAAEEVGEPLELVTLSRSVNLRQPKHISNLCVKATEILGLSKARVAILGLAFRGDIDDTRLSPTYSIINCLLNSIRNCDVIVHDPYVAYDRILLDMNISLTQNLHEALKSRNIVVIATNHTIYSNLTLREIMQTTESKKVAIIDAHNIIKDWKKPPKGCVYVGSGRPWVINI